MSSVEYVDTNGNGVPDAFENRPPISEILNAPPDSLTCDRGRVILELESRVRTPRRGEWFIHNGKLERAWFNYSNYEALIVTRIIAGEMDTRP